MGGLVLTRKFGEAVVIGGDVTVRVLRGEDRSDRVRLHIDAPRETVILREEIAGAPEPWRWLSWADFQSSAPRRRGEYVLTGLLVRRPGAVACGVVFAVETFPPSFDPELVVEWEDGSDREVRASDVEWKVSS